MKTLLEMTSAGSVGVGLVKPLAADFNKKHRRGGLKALRDFLYALGVNEDIGRQVQHVLVNQYGDYTVAGNLGSLSENSSRAWHSHRGDEVETLHILNRIIDGPMDDVLLSKSDVGGIDPYGRHVTVKKAHIRKYKPHNIGRKAVKVSRAIKSKGKKVKKYKGKKLKIKNLSKKGKSVKRLRPVYRKTRVHEGLGYADDSDGRGKGVAGGSPYGSDGRLPSAEYTQCPKCGSPSFQEKSDGSKVCDRCRSSYGMAYITGSSTGTNNGTWGNVRLPGGSMGTNEVRITCLDTNLYEITVNGATTTHTRPVMPEALRHMVSPFGITYKLKLQSVLEWLWHKAKPGDTLVFDHVGKAKYVVGNQGYKYGMED